MAHSSAPVDSYERFNTHSRQVPGNVRNQLVNQNSPPTSHWVVHTEIIGTVLLKFLSGFLIKNVFANSFAVLFHSRAYFAHFHEQLSKEFEFSLDFCTVFTPQCRVAVLAVTMSVSGCECECGRSIWTWISRRKREAGRGEQSSQRAADNRGDLRVTSILVRAHSCDDAMRAVWEEEREGKGRGLFESCTKTPSAFWSTLFHPHHLLTSKLNHHKNIEGPTNVGDPGPVRRMVQILLA